VRNGIGDYGTVRVWRLADGTPVGPPLTGHTRVVWAVAVGALPDGTPVIVSGSRDDTVLVWRLADGTPVGPPLTGHTGTVWAGAVTTTATRYTGAVWAVAIGALKDGTPVIVSGGRDDTVLVWRLADGTRSGRR
jgi:WD40 repeat protein